MTRSFNLLLFEYMSCDILCVIPARSGSKELPHKNIKNYKGHPLLAHSIIQAKQSRYDMRIVVSTDSEEYAGIAKIYGAEIPFLRPTEISQDLSTDYECIDHCLKRLKEYDNYEPDIILQLRPTQPERTVKHIDDCLEQFIEVRHKYDSLRTVIPIDKSPYKMYLIGDQTLVPLFQEVNGITEPYNRCRQELPQAYLHNGYIDIMNYDTVIKQKSVTGNKIYPCVMDSEDKIDIDTQRDWNIALGD